MLRRAVIDPLRLAVRWAIKRWATRIVVFAAMPTRREMEGLVAKAMAMAGAIPAGKWASGGIVQPNDRNKSLH